MEIYPIIKALHIISMTAWMAGMLYLPRLFVYHAGVRAHSPESTLFKVMERRLLKAIINPAMIMTFVLGIWLALHAGYFGAGVEPPRWLEAKLGLVLAMSALHGYFSGCVRRFSRDANTKKPGFYKFINELVTLFFIGIVLLVVLKPSF